jgi:hypothetical protein
MQRSIWERLPNYDCTMPSGVAIGKRWRRTDSDGDWVGEMIRVDESTDWHGVEIVFRPVIFVAAP